jgi:large subunit ribosomal protein L15
MRLHDIKPNPGAKHRKRRVGNGESSGLGKTCGKGNKGQKARSGASIRPNFEGGQMPIFRRLPKKGFNNSAFRTNLAIVNLNDLEAKFNSGDKVNEATLRACGLVQGVWDGIKVLGNGALTKKLSVEVFRASATAKVAIEKVGGSLHETAAEKAAQKIERNQKKPAKA